MREEVLGGLKVRLAGGTDREGGGDGPMVVLMHGFGASGSDLVPLWRQLRVPRDTRFAFPEAPMLLDTLAPGYDSRAWWMIDVERLQRSMLTGEIRDLPKENPPELAQVNALVCAMLDALAERYAVRGDRLVLGGFSQGAMLACDVAWRTERQLAGLVVLSGTLLAESVWLPLLGKRKGLPVFMSHGRSDEILPYALAERLRDELMAAGLPVRFSSFGSGHGIADSVLEELGTFITDVTEKSA